VEASGRTSSSNLESGAGIKYKINETRKYFKNQQATVLAGGGARLVRGEAVNTIHLPQHHHYFSKHILNLYSSLNTSL
jgi:hypothetical protein